MRQVQVPGIRATPTGLYLILTCCQDSKALSGLFAGWRPMLLTHTALTDHTMSQQALDRKHLPIINYRESAGPEILSTCPLLPGFVCVIDSEGRSGEKVRAKCTRHQLLSCRLKTPPLRQSHQDFRDLCANLAVLWEMLGHLTTNRHMQETPKEISVCFYRSYSKG